ncbi:hypothetical protein KGQ20_37055 [Catenulispora sp. NF23]|uniref:Polymerase nucleotidyl transferase domain-containing protein n=1 Tax=Catenulispora pinistramenti TaxID=2705254 RepID=A0ABS5KWD6_9ACTN|nr:nucleotidyltransferase domain-containing protein [Catenulispora pinistramenti]MBS2538375.1 hypothetical protein [Catenulispora pinistramenti]MBS2550387.1 hypothetical protein [Catenulispora pinistramenti]
MFTASDRDQILRTLIERAEADPDVTGAVLLGSTASGDADRWSDLDVAFTVDGAARAGVAGVAERWTDWLAAGPGVVHHWDLPTGTAQLIRVFLLPNGLELDLNFYPEGELVRRGPAWRPVFGDFADDKAWTPTPNPGAETRETGLTWHHLLHARTCVERGRDWQAEHWIGQARTHIIALACLRLGYPTAYAKGAHLLPAEVSEPLRGTLVRSLDTDELRRALMVAVEAFERELLLHDPALAERLRPLLTEG